MKKFLEWLGLRKKPTPVKPKPYKRPPKVCVHLTNGLRVVHYAGCRKLGPDGTLTLYSKWSAEEKRWKEEDLVAEYAPGTWMSITTGTRKVSKNV